MIGLADLLTNSPPFSELVRSVALTVKEVTAAPPLEAGGLKETVAWALDDVAVPMTGAPGTVAGVAAFEAVEGTPVPTPLVAVTAKV